MRVILLGSPGAGKGTQAKLISRKYHIPQISTGDILRYAIQQNSLLGKNVKEIVESGRLVPDEVVIRLVNERLQQLDCQSGFLLDGFPRTLSQAQALAKITEVDCVIDIEVSDDEIVKRLSGRRIHPASGRVYHVIYQPSRIKDKDDLTGELLLQRPDDKEETVRKRLALYHAETQPVRDYYQELSALQKLYYYKIVGEQPIEEISQQIFRFLDSMTV